MLHADLWACFNVPENVPCFNKVPEEAVGRAGPTHRNTAATSAENPIHRSFLEQARLKPCLDYIEWACHDGPAHSTQPIDQEQNMVSATLIITFLAEL